MPRTSLKTAKAKEEEEIAEEKKEYIKKEKKTRET